MNNTCMNSFYYYSNYFFNIVLFSFFLFQAIIWTKKYGLGFFNLFEPVLWLILMFPGKNKKSI